VGGASVAFDVPARMRDGVVLRANVYRPDDGGLWPVLLARTPYGKDDAGHLHWSGLDPLEAVRQGFIVVVQDVRGRFASDGEWAPYRAEREDGFDTVEWAARLPGSNGRVGMYSGSYCGNVQWLAAAERPPSLAAISPALTWSEPMDGLLARGGALELGLALRWALENGFDPIARLGLDDDERRRRIAALADEWDRLAVGDAYRDLPVDARAALRRHRDADLGAIAALDDPAIADFCRVTGLHEQVAVPSLHTAGWYDVFLQGTLDNFRAASAAGRDAQLVVGPWTHHAFGDPVGERLFGIRAGRDGVPYEPGTSWTERQLAWFRRQLAPEAGNADGAGAGSPVRIFVMGRNAWREETAWPPTQAVEQRWFLGPDGVLAPAPPADRAASSTFAYDPADPVPTVGGHGVMSVAHTSGPCDQRAVEARVDVLVFTSAPLREALEVTGRVRVVLHAESSAPSTDWVARLCDVDPDGRSLNLCDGIVRVAEGAGAPREIEIDLWSTSNVFLRGHCIRVHVTSSSFPRWDRNLNTRGPRTPRWAVARQQVHHDAERRSWIELPVME
jgi:uncharacterized protein